MSRLQSSAHMRAMAIQDRAAGKIDGQRSSEQRAQRQRYIRNYAERMVAVPFAANDDAVQFLRFVIIAASKTLSVIARPGQAENLHGALSRREPAPRVDAKAEAERLAHRFFPNPANDGGEDV